MCRIVWWPTRSFKSDLHELIMEVHRNRLSTEKGLILGDSIEKPRSLFRIRLGSRGPAKLPPMTITIYSTNPPVKDRVGIYPASQKKCLDANWSKFLAMGFMKPCFQASCQGTLHIMPKESKAQFHSTIDPRPVNTSTKTEQWQMPIIGAKLSDVKFSILSFQDFFEGYLQCPFDPSSYSAYGMIGPQAAFLSTPTLHGQRMHLHISNQYFRLYSAV